MGRSCRIAPLPLRWTTVPLTRATIPSGRSVDVARAQREHLAGAHGGPEQDLDDVADLAVGLRAREARARFASCAAAPDRGDLFERERLRLALRLRSGDVPSTGLRDDGVVPQREREQQVEQGARLLGPRVRRSPPAT